MEGRSLGGLLWRHLEALGFGGRERGHGGDRVAAAGGGVEGDLRLVGAVPAAYSRPVADLAAAPALQPAAGFQQLPRVYSVSC